MASVLDEIRKVVVWRKGREVPGYNPDVVRMDDLGNYIAYNDYGNRSSAYGWEMDHHPMPKALGGSDDISNLRPLHYSANARYGAFLAAALNPLL